MTRKARTLGLMEAEVYMGIFDFKVVCIAGPYEKALEYVAWKFEEDDMSHIDNWGYKARGKCFFRSGYVPVIWIPRYPASAREHATLAHEAVHAAMHLFQWASLQVEPATEEVFGHTIGHIVNETLVAFAAQKKLLTRNRKKR